MTAYDQTIGWTNRVTNKNNECERLNFSSHVDVDIQLVLIGHDYFLYEKVIQMPLKEGMVEDRNGRINIFLTPIKSE